MDELLASIAAKKERLDALEHASLRDDFKPFQAFMHRRLDATLGELSALEEAQTPEPGRDKPNRDV